MILKFLPFLLIFALLNSAIELEISAPSFPDIMEYFQVSEQVIGLSISYNLFGFCLAALIYVPLSECFGRRIIMLVGNGILVIGTSFYVIAPSSSFLLAARFIQGLGAATSAVVVSAIIADIYPPNKATKLYGLMNAIFITLMALSPSLGTIITTNLGWRGNYGIVATISLVSWLLLCCFLPETKKGKSKLSPGKILADYKYLITSRLFLSAASIPSLFYGCYLAFVTLAPFIYLDIFALSMFSYIIHQGIVITSFAFTSLLANKITHHLGLKQTMLTALIFATIGSILASFSTLALICTFAMSIFCIGFSLIYPPLFAYSLAMFPHIKGPASSLIMSLRYLLCTCITALASMIYAGSMVCLGVVFCIATAIIALLFFNLLSKLETTK